MEQYYKDNFYSAVVEQGEDLTIYYVSPDADIEEYNVKASIVTATSAAYNMTDREYLFKGDMTLPEGIHRRYLSGCYVKRASYPNKTYLMLSVISSPVSEKLAYIYMIQCTNEVTLCEPVEIEDEWENTKEAFVPYAKDIHGYFSTVLRTMKSTNDGSLDAKLANVVATATDGASEPLELTEAKGINYEITIDGKPYASAKNDVIAGKDADGPANTSTVHVKVWWDQTATEVPENTVKKLTLTLEYQQA